MAERYELVVVGAGAAGSTAAETANRAGRRVALVERDRLGGTCLNYGCDPTKTMLRSAHLLFHARHADRYGLHIPQAEADWAAVQARVEAVIRRIRGGTMEEARAAIEARGIALFLGEARFEGPHELRVGDRTLHGEQIILATGGKPQVPPIEGLKEAGFLTNEEAVSLAALPRRLAVIGGGPIGIEFAQLFHRFGVEVTVLETGDTLLPRDDRELAERLCTLLSEEGITLRTGVQAKQARCESVEGGKRLTFGGKGEDEQETIEVDEILLATGREPVVDALNLAAAGVEADEEGIKRDETLRTTTPHIWAAGDVTGGYQFTHVASAQGKLAAHNAFANQPEPFDEHPIPWVTYTDPALAHVGQTEEQLRAAGTPYRAQCLTLDKLDRAIINGETEGMIKLLVGEGDQLLGGHLLAPHAGDLIAPVVLAMRHRLPVLALAETILPYPNLVEGVRWAADQR